MKYHTLLPGLIGIALFAVLGSCADSRNDVKEQDAVDLPDNAPTDSIKPIENTGFIVDSIAYHELFDSLYHSVDSRAIHTLYKYEVLRPLKGDLFRIGDSALLNSQSIDSVERFFISARGNMNHPDHFTAIITYTNDTSAAKAYRNFKQEALEFESQGPGLTYRHDFVQ